jgi:hypothetical protein
MALTLYGLPESLDGLCMLFPDITADMNSIQATIQRDGLAIPSSARSWLERGAPDDGRSAIKLSASMLASEADHRRLADLLIFEARLSTA